MDFEIKVIKKCVLKHIYLCAILLLPYIPHINIYFKFQMMDPEIQMKRGKRSKLPCMNTYSGGTGTYIQTA